MSSAVIKPQGLAGLYTEGDEIDLLDVSTPVEYRESQVDIARNVPPDRLDPGAMMHTRNGSADGPLYLTRRAGSRGLRACEECRDGPDVENETGARFA